MWCWKAGRDWKIKTAYFESVKKKGSCIYLFVLKQFDVEAVTKLCVQLPCTRGSGGCVSNLGDGVRTHTHPAGMLVPEPVKARPCSEECARTQSHGELAGLCMPTPAVRAALRISALAQTSPPCSQLILWEACRALLLCVLFFYFFYFFFCLV